MNNKEILEKAFTIATNNGFNQRDVEPDIFMIPEAFIYRHDFAKALWGDKPYYRFDGDTLETPKQWQYHLQQMVISDDPIKYLGDNILKP